MGIMTGEKMSLTWASLIGQFVHLVGGDWIKRVDGGRIVSLASYKFHFVRVHDILV